MEILTDIHTHTLATPHAYSTVYENLQFAKKAGLEAFAVTDHSLRLPDAPHVYHFENLKAIPKEAEGVRIFRGIELNILDKDGSIDMEEYILKTLDIVVASIHRPCYRHIALDDHTETYLNVLDNPYITVLGHTDSSDLMYDTDKVLLKAKENNVLIEINNLHIEKKKNYERATEIALRCKELGVGIAVNSDAHICFDMGVRPRSERLLSEIDFPEELIINRNLETLNKFLALKKR